MATGSYKIWTADKDGNPTKLPAVPEVPNDPNKEPNPAATEAADIYFGLPGSAPQPPPKEQIDLQGEIGKVLRSVQRLYLEAHLHGAVVHREKKFRIYYVRLFRLAQLGLEGANAAPDIAKGALAVVTADLIDDEAGRVKNGHMRELGRCAAIFAIPCLVLYAVLRLTGDGAFARALEKLDVQASVLANFSLLWGGCFIGVWLSYGVRTTVFSLSDLTTTDSDRLVPKIRLIFAGILTMLLGIAFVLGLIEVKIGHFPITDIATQPMLAFIVGVFCGISELALPSSVAKRASDFIGSLK